DGLCNILIEFEPNIPMDTVDVLSARAMDEAAFEIYRICTLWQSRAGEIRGLGEEGHLILRIERNPVAPSPTEHISCINAPGRPPNEANCNRALDLVPLRRAPQRFGPVGTPGVQVGLPVMWRDLQTGGCDATLTADEGLVGVDVWWLWWLRGKTVNAMCVRRGLSGRYVVD
ncbi:MAG: hypothetical protein Q9174_006924, partial [Haloplaca sp. 1 TL-2023]